ncbi:MAG: nucleoside triphosphate pyrophosphohydrolase [Candidatus Gracilibacteria bacterium]|nr:nucleoside triphosphate pyrophosphohydrolase [Candidatus Gracilibacteria bacterium]
MSKLVRDKIPEIITRNDEIIPSTHIAIGEDLLDALDKKLDEEIAEFRSAPDAHSAVEEIADIIEVLLALAHFRGFSPEQIEAIRLEKRAKRGGFEKGIILE